VLAAHRTWLGRRARELLDRGLLQNTAGGLLPASEAFEPEAGPRCAPPAASTTQT